MRITSQKGFSGIDTRKTLADGIVNAADILNLRVTDSGSLQKREAILKRMTFADTIDGLWSGILNGVELVAVVSAGTLYTLTPSSDESGSVKIIGGCCNGKCRIFEFNGALYIKGSDYYGKFDGKSVSPVEGYIPTVALSCAPDGSGTPFEQINLLTDKRRQLFSGDGKTLVYKLAEDGIESIVSIKVDGENYAYNYSLEGQNSISFEAPPTEGLNNVEVIYRKPLAQSDRDRIMKCTDLMLFGGNSDGRAFLWGNDDLPNHRFHSDLADGVPSVEYFPINAFTVIGNSKITCIIQQYDRQLIFTKNEAYYSYSELRDDGLGNINTSFPVFSLNGSKGCLIESVGCVIDNRPVTLCDDGFNMWESTSVVNEKNAICFSAPISGFLNELTKSERESIKIFDFQANREFYCIVGNVAYIYNYGNGAWYRFSGFKGSHYSVFGNRLFFSKGNELYYFGHGNGYDDVIVLWESPFITNKNDTCNFDVTLIEADVFIDGGTKLTFDTEKSNGEFKSATFNYSYTEESGRFHRITFRPALKRAMPFLLRFTVEGNSSFALHGISIKTRQKERSR